MDDLAGTAREAFDPLGQVEDRDRRAGIADIERVADRLRAFEAEQKRLDHVVHVAPGSDLRAVTVDGEVTTRERSLDESPDRTAADLPGAVDVERPHRCCRE